MPKRGLGKVVHAGREMVWGKGAVAGGFIVGMAESLSVPLIGAEYRAATAFVVLIAMLLVRPTGLFGEKA